MNKIPGANQGRKVIFGVAVGIVISLILFMGVSYMYRDEMKASMLKEYEERVVLAEPAGFTESQIREIFTRYTTLYDTIQIADNTARELGVAMHTAADDQLIDATEAAKILSLMRKMTDILGPYDSGEPGIIERPLQPDSVSSDSLE